MLENSYRTESSVDFMTFEFESVGTKGIITKVVKYTEVASKGYYNLGFGDKDPVTGHISDLSISNNDDTKKILTTVASTLFTFTNHYPDAIVIAAGSTDTRTRLYRIGIANNLIAVEHDFKIFGLTSEGWELFRKNIIYQAFAVSRKKVNL